MININPRMDQAKFILLEAIFGFKPLLYMALIRYCGKFLLSGTYPSSNNPG